MDTSNSKQAWAAHAADGPRTLAEKAFEALHEAIVSGALAPGERLRITDLAATLGVSHLPVREAIRRLESTGLVEHIPHRGGRVTELSLQDLHEIYDARLLLEPEIVSRAAQTFTDEDARTASAWLERQATAEEQGDISEVWSAHTEFHFTLYRASRSSWLLRLVTAPWESSQRYRMTLAPLNSARRRLEAHEEHLAILDACIGHDERGAALLLHDHLAKTANLIADHMGGDRRFELKAERGIREATSFRPETQSFAPVRPKVDGATVETRDLTVTTYRYQPGATWQEHAHPEDQMTMLLSGDALAFRVDGREVELRPGELVLIPGGTPHSATVGNGEVVTLNVWRLRKAVPT